MASFMSVHENSVSVVRVMLSPKVRSTVGSCVPLRNLHLLLEHSVIAHVRRLWPWPMVSAQQERPAK